MTPAYFAISQLQELRGELLAKRDQKKADPTEEPAPVPREQESVILPGETPDAALERLLWEHRSSSQNNTENGNAAASSSRGAPSAEQAGPPQAGAREMVPVPAAVVQVVENVGYELEPNLGIIHAVGLDGQQSQEQMIRLARIAQVYFLGLWFTADRLDLVEACVAAAARGVEVEVGVDKTWTLGSRCKDQYAAVRALVAGGVKVRLVVGTDRRPHYAAVGRNVGGIGHQHAKIAHSDRGSVVGSSNMTTSSRSNNECGVHFSLFPARAMSWRYELSAYIGTGIELAEAEKGHNIQRYCRSKGAGGRARSLGEMEGGWESV